jgi:hypothetical protein
MTHGWIQLDQSHRAAIDDHADSSTFDPLHRVAPVDVDEPFAPAWQDRRPVGEARLGQLRGLRVRMIESGCP